MAISEFLQFAPGPGANVLSQAAYAADALRLTGNIPGIARSNINNKALLQSTTLAAAVALFIANKQSNDVVDSASVADIASWMEDAVLASSILDTVRIDVASAATVDLTALAPDTRHINITGVAAITGFTVAAGLCYFVRFSNAATLTNSASLVTQSGQDITAGAGDTCIIRATAANVVEVLCYTRAADSYDTGWLSPTLQNSYTAESGNGVKYCKVGKTVYIAGGVRRASAIGGSQTIFTLPAGFRPAHSGQLGAGVWVYDAIGTQLMTINVTTGGLFNTGAIASLGGNVTGAGGASFLYSFVVP